MKDKRFRLLLFDAMGKRAALRVGIMLLIVAVLVLLDRSRPFLDDYRLWVQGSIFVLIVLLAYCLLRLARTSVIVYEGHLLIQGVVNTLSINYEEIDSITPTKLSREYPLKQITTGEWRRLSRLYEEPCALISLRNPPISAVMGRLLFPKFLFTPDRLGVLLLVDNWIELSKSVETARAAWRSQIQEHDSGGNEQETLIFEEDVLAADEHPTVLVVEENGSQRQRLQQLLEMHFTVLSVKDGVEALQQARQHRPDLILMHPNPARMGGEAFLKALRRHPALKETPVILLAYKDERQACLDVLEAGANDYLFVPFTRQELQFRLYNWLKLRARERELQVLNDLLHQKTLTQMAELVRRGELLHFLPATVAQKIMSGQISGKTEPFRRQKVTVLFIDIVGFTDLTGRLEPQVLSELLNEYLREMTAVANKYNGTVDKFIGDAVMVLFGAPQEKEEALQAWEAAQAALEMIRVVEGMSLIWASRLPRPLQVRVGFNTGSCTAGVFGNEMLRSYTVVGSAVNIAARLQTAAQPGSVICSRESFQHFQGRVHMRELGFLTLKGVNHPVEALELLKLAESHESQATI